jgi:hypothetical protein
VAVSVGVVGEVGFGDGAVGVVGVAGGAFGGEPFGGGGAVVLQTGSDAAAVEFGAGGVAGGEGFGVVDEPVPARGGNLVQASGGSGLVRSLGVEPVGGLLAALGAGQDGVTGGLVRELVLAALGLVDRGRRGRLDALGSLDTDQKQGSFVLDQAATFVIFP